MSDYYDYIDQEAALAEAYFYEQHLQQQYEEEEIEDINANFNTYKY